MLKLFPDRTLPKRLRELNKMGLFAELSRREVRVVDGFMHERGYLKDEIIFDEGEQGEAFYLVLEGQVLICRQGEVDQPIATLGVVFVMLNAGDKEAPQVQSIPAHPAELDRPARLLRQ